MGNKMTELRGNISIIAFNINSLPKEREIGRVRKKYEQIICHIQEAHFEFDDKDRFKTKGQKNIYHTNIKQTNARVNILLSKLVDLRTNKITRDKKRHGTLINDQFTMKT